MTDKRLYINIGLVGHVANGKTTLVRQLTGVNTKRNSREKKSGRTIQLGYANCRVWKCENCGKVASTGQSQKSWECCGNVDTTPEQYISFADCPGHHSYVQNMIKGAGIIDGAILVTDARQDKLLTQSLEHLAILDVIGVRNIIVIQNKIDLVDSEACLTHYHMLKKELKGTVAENAPIIPVSAQQGVGIPHVQTYLYRMTENIVKHLHPFSKNIFSIVRSFDINKPGTEIDQLKGGVLGGTPIGEAGYQIGDIVEIRPGFLTGPTTYRPLKTKINSIFSESDTCKGMGRGGLYGLGTILDPTLTKNDRLVGCLVGKPEDLPDVKTELSMQVFKMHDAEKVKEDSRYVLIIGSTVVPAICIRRKKKKAKMKLLKPICIINKKCIIYSASSQLIGFGVMEEEDEIKTETVPQTEQEYIKLIPIREREDKVRAKIPIPMMCRENRNVIWSNMSVFCQTIHREEAHITAYIQQELCVNASICQNGLRIYKTRLRGNRFQSLLKKYIVERISCGECKGVDTEIRKQKGYNEIVCRTCGSIRSE